MQVLLLKIHMQVLLLKIHVHFFESKPTTTMILLFDGFGRLLMQRVQIMMEVEHLKFLQIKRQGSLSSLTQVMQQVVHHQQYGKQLVMD